MKNLFKHLVAWVVLLLVIGFYSLFVGCAVVPETIVSKKTTSLKQDLIAKTIINKKKSRLQKMLAEILNGGVIISIKVDAKRYADGTETSRETWIVENSKEDRFVAIWENGVLISINDIEKPKADKPMGG